LQNDPKWVSVREVFAKTDNTDFLKRAGVENLNDSLFAKYNTRLTQLRNILKYEFSVIGLGSDRNYEEVVEIFIRVNSLGTKLKSSDLALAQITAKWNGSLALFESFQEELNEEVSIGTIVRALNTTITGQAKFDKVGKMTKEVLEGNWKATQENIKAALDFLETFIPAALISPYFVVLLTWWAKNGRELNSDLKKWVILASQKGRYSGSTETSLDQDLKANNAEELLSLLKKRFGNLETLPEDLGGRNTNSGYFSTMFLAMKAAGAKDWKSGLGISIEHLAKKNKIEFHHIFPKAFMRGVVPDAEINDIANLAFIGSETNKWITNRAPEEYFAELRQEKGDEEFDKLLLAQCVPNDPELWRQDNYKVFIAKRRELIVEMFNKYLNGF